ncbi:MAG: hypothetical protein SFX72_03045 [Isosphaeraceae bacterium]|nr:hypothetical protein [Isosphaeraceae bacterium]
MSVNKFRYRQIFSDTAGELRLWILVRETNELSYRFIHRLDFVSKPIDIKAKTADHDAAGREIGGLVVDPTIEEYRDAFGPGKRAKAVALWNELLAERPDLSRGRSSGPYAIVSDPASPRFGCLTFNGMCIHGDFDLYDVVDPGHSRANLGLVRETVPVAGSAKTMIDVIPRGWHRVASIVNGRVGKTVIHHGGDYQWITKEKSAGHAEDSVEAYGPDREVVNLRGRHSIAAFYGNRFPGRKSLRQHH